MLILDKTDITFVEVFMLCNALVRLRLFPICVTMCKKGFSIKRLSMGSNFMFHDLIFTSSWKELNELLANLVITSVLQNAQ